MFDRESLGTLNRCQGDQLIDSGASWEAVGKPQKVTVLVDEVEGRTFVRLAEKEGTEQLMRGRELF